MTKETVKVEDLDSELKIEVEIEGEELAPEIEGEELIPETLEELAQESISDAVAIAAIDADKEIQIAEIQAETTLAVIEAETERETTWQEQVQSLQANMTELVETVATLKTLVELSLPTLTEAGETMTVEEVENNLIPQSTPELTSETVMEVIQESGDGKPEMEVSVTTRKKRRLI